MPHKYYNAVNLFYQGNYQLVGRALDTSGSWRKAWEKIGGQTRLNPEKEWQKLLKNDVRLVLLEDNDFPPLLREIPLTPFGLYIKGDFIFSMPGIAIVGTRKATHEGLHISQKFGRELAEQNRIVVSGLALGIDQAAHRGVMDIGGKAIAVLANGLDDVYPQQNKPLAEKILKNGGALVSEYPLGTPSYPVNFLERNRIISGLSCATIVIEAPLKSGSLVTAHCAVEQNRDVFVVPGPITHPNYFGSYRLIKEGAILITEISDIFNQLNLPFYPSTAQLSAKKIADLTSEQKMVLNYIETTGYSLPVDKIIELTKLEPHVVNQALTSLVINDVIKEYNGRYSLV